MTRLTAAREVFMGPIGLLRGAVYSLDRTSRMTVGEQLRPILGEHYR